MSVCGGLPSAENLLEQLASSQQCMSWLDTKQALAPVCCMQSMHVRAGDAVMGMVVTHLVFASTSCADCETLHDRRKVMVSSNLAGLLGFTEQSPGPAALACQCISALSNNLH